MKRIQGVCVGSAGKGVEPLSLCVVPGYGTLWPLKKCVRMPSREILMSTRRGGGGSGGGGGVIINDDALTTLLFCDAQLVLNVTPSTSETSLSSSSSFSSASIGHHHTRNGYGHYSNTNTTSATWELASVAESFCSILGGLLEGYDTYYRYIRITHSASTSYQPTPPLTLTTHSHHSPCPLTPFTHSTKQPLSTHPLHSPCPSTLDPSHRPALSLPTLSSHSSKYYLSIHPFNPPSPFTIDPSQQDALSTHPFNPPSPLTLSIHYRPIDRQVSVDYIRWCNSRTPLSLSLTQRKAFSLALWSVVKNNGGGKGLGGGGGRVSTPSVSSLLAEEEEPVKEASAAQALQASFPSLTVFCESGGTVTHPCTPSTPSIHPLRHLQHTLRHTLIHPLIQPLTLLYRPLIYPHPLFHFRLPHLLPPPLFHL